jgi:hypothetical protein
MARIVAVYKDEELQAVVDYVSRLSWPADAAATGSGAF